MAENRHFSFLEGEEVGKGNKFCQLKEKITQIFLCKKIGEREKKRRKSPKFFPEEKRVLKKNGE